MARYIDSVCRLCRREGLKLFLKGDRCYSDRCAFDRRGYPPGQHGQQRSKFSEYGIQLREKQKVRRIYGLGECQFHNCFEKAENIKGVTGENLLTLLERRLDNMVFRIGFATTRAEARQLVRHGHVRVNGRKVNIPSYLCKTGDVIDLSEKARKIGKVSESLKTVARRELPNWIDIEAGNFKGTVKSLPRREDLTMPIQEQLIVELYSK